MKVVIVSKALVATMYRRKLSDLARLGLDVIAVVPPEWREGGRVQRLEEGPDDSYELIVSPMRWNGHFHIHAYPELPRILRRVQPDLVHVDEEPFNLATFLGVRAAVSVGACPLFFTWQNIMRRLPPPFSMFEQRVYRLCPGALAGNEDSASVLRAKGYRGAISVVPQFGVDTKTYAPGDAETTRSFTVGFLNRLIPAKGPFVVLDAMSRLPADIHLLFVGDGPLRGRLVEEIERRSLAARVELRDRVASTQMPDLLRTLDAVVLPSLTTNGWKEQFGRILVEAMASGVPVIGSDSGEIPRVIGEAGIIVPEGDAEALAAAIERLKNDAELRHSLSLAGRRRAVSCFSSERIADRTVEAYHRALEARMSIASA